MALQAQYSSYFKRGPPCCYSSSCKVPKKKHKSHAHWPDFLLAILQIRLCALYNGSRRMKICLSIAFSAQVIVLTALMLACHVSMRSTPISLVIIACTLLSNSSDSGTISWNSCVYSHIYTKLVSNMVGTTGFIWCGAFRARLARRDQKSAECGIGHRTEEVSPLIDSQHDFGERQRFILLRVRKCGNAPPLKKKWTNTNTYRILSINLMNAFMWLKLRVWSIYYAGF